MSMQNASDEVQQQNMEDLAERIVTLERWISRQEVQIKGLKGRVEELERR
jgi:uncharacterized coiled-coil protein SlyX